MVMSSEKFEDLEDDLRNLTQDIKKKLEICKSRPGSEDKKSIIREAQRKLDEAYTILQDLENEAQTAPNPYRVHMISKTKQYHQEVEDVNKKLTVLAGSRTVGFDLSRQELFPSSDIGMPTQNSRLRQINDTLDRTTESIVRSHRVAAETDEIGITVADELRTQRDALVRTQERLEETDHNLSRSRKILRSMYRRVITNKLILIVIIVLELGILVGVAYWKFGPK